MRFLLLATLILSAVACSPNIHYLGDVFAPTTEVDVFYDEGDIKNDYRVIGQLSGDNQGFSGNGLDEIKAAMIEEAKKRGANGILFLFSDSFDDSHVVKAKLLRYRS